MKKIYIHVGAGKTGTTAIQNFMFLNRQELANQGLHIPSQGSNSMGESITHHALADFGRYKSPEGAISLWHSIGELDFNCMLVSSEIFHSRISDKDGPEFFKFIKSALAKMEVKIVFYIRRQSQWFQSAYSQWVQVNLQHKTIQQLAKSYHKTLPDQVLAFGKIFGIDNVIVRPFEKTQFVNGNLIDDFLSSLNLEPSDHFKIPKGNPNPRLTGDALEVMRLINQFAQSEEEKRPIVKLLMNYSKVSNSRDSQAVYHRHNIMPASLALEIEEEMEPLYREIAVKYLGRSDGQLFIEEASDVASVSDESEPNRQEILIYILYQLLLKDVDNRVKIRKLLSIISSSQ